MHFVFNKRILFCILTLCMLVVSANSQNDSLANARKKQEEEQKKKWLAKERFYWGGNIAAWFGNPSFVDVSPLVGYMITPKLGIGIGGIYNYYAYTYGAYQYKVNMYGGRINGRYFIFENVFLQGGWDRINRDNPFSAKPDARIWIDNLLIGGGFRFAAGDNFGAVISGMWNLNQGPLSPYPNPILQIGLIGGF